MVHVRKVDESEFPVLQKIAKKYFSSVKSESCADFENLPKTGYNVSGEGYVRAIDPMGIRVAGFKPSDKMKLWVGEELASPMKAEIYFIGKTEENNPACWECTKGKVQKRTSCGFSSSLVSRIQLVAGKRVENGKPIIEVLDVGKNPVRFQSDW